MFRLNVLKVHICPLINQMLPKIIFIIHICNKNYNIYFIENMTKIKSFTMLLINDIEMYSYIILNNLKNTRMICL